MAFRGAADAVDDVVGRSVVQPGAAVDALVGGFRGRDEGEVRDDGVRFAHDVAVPGCDIGPDHRFGRIAVHPLVEVPAPAHDALGRFKDGHDVGEVCYVCRSHAGHTVKVGFISGMGKFCSAEHTVEVHWTYSGNVRDRQQGGRLPVGGSPSSGRGPAKRPPIPDISFCGRIAVANVPSFGTAGTF